MESGLKFIQELAIILLAASLGAKAARWTGIPTMVGYLIGGFAAGALDMMFLNLTDPAQLRILTQVGIVFVMFSMGLQTRLSDLRYFGPGPFVAVALTALIMFSLGRITGSLVGLNAAQSLFFTAMLMISSATTINKYLDEWGLHHRRTGQMARGQTMLETVLAVVLLCALSPVPGSNAVAGGEIYPLLLLRLIAFGVLLVLIGMLVIPWVLRRARPDPDGELQTIFLIAILFGFSAMAVFAGYTLALGAFLTGLITSEIPRSRASIRLFTGARSVFTAIFFVAIGMATDLREMVGSAGLILIGSLVALGGRFAASALAWILACEEENRALRIALMVTPAGAFSLIIARLGIENGVLPQNFQTVAVGIVVLTGVLGSKSMHLSERINVRAPSAFPKIASVLLAYRSLWHSIGKRGGTRFLWTFIKPRVWQVSREVLCVTAVLLAARPLYQPFVAALIRFGLDERWLPLGTFVYWFVAAALALPSLVALLRNLDALSMLVADFLRMQLGERRRGLAIHLTLLRIVIFGAVGLWLATLLPWDLLGLGFIGVLAIATLITARMSWRWFIRVHHQMERDLKEMVEPDYHGYRAGAFYASSLRSAREDWDLHLKEFKLPDLFFAAGQTIGSINLRNRTGATIIGIDRQYLAINQITPQTQLFSGDTLFLLGTQNQIERAVTLLDREDDKSGTAATLHRAVLNSLVIAPSSSLVGRCLSEIDWSPRLGVQILAVRSGGHDRVSPPAATTLSAGDTLLIAGTESAIKAARQSTEEGPSTIAREPRPNPQPTASHSR